MTAKVSKGIKRAKKYKKVCRCLQAFLYFKQKDTLL